MTWVLIGQASGTREDVEFLFLFSGVLAFVVGGMTTLSQTFQPKGLIYLRMHNFELGSIKG